MNWDEILKSEKEKPYFRGIIDQLNLAYQERKIIFPDKKNIFNALK